MKWEMTRNTTIKETTRMNKEQGLRRNGKAVSLKVR